MLASPANLGSIRYPVYGSPKLDGIRGSVCGGRLLTRSLKRVPNQHIYSALSNAVLEGLDGELIVGMPNSPTCYRDTVSGVMAMDGQPDYAYFVFDWWDHGQAFTNRRLDLQERLRRLKNDWLTLVPVDHVLLRSREELDAYEAEVVGRGFEGIMLADPHGNYKYGRATPKSGELLKVKRFEDGEAVVIGVEEEMFNGNEAETNELGRTKRSTAKEGLVGKGTMGALIVRDVKTGVEFNIGTGFTAADRIDFWQARDLHCTAKTVVKYKFFPVGVKDKPRHPVYLGLRPAGA
jgi:DNA ligase-1